MMEDFEKELKKHFQERSITPSENAWERMEQLLDEQQPVSKKKKSFFYVWSAAASVVVLIGLWLFWKPTNQVFPETKEKDVFVATDTLKNIKQQLQNTSQLAKADTVFNKPVVAKKKTRLSTPFFNHKKEEVQEVQIVQIKEPEIKELPLKTESIEVTAEIVSVETTEIHVNPNKLLRSAEMERQVENMVSDGQNFWKKIKEVNAVVQH